MELDVSHLTPRARLSSHVDIIQNGIDEQSYTPKLNSSFDIELDCGLTHQPWESKVISNHSHDVSKNKLWDIALFHLKSLYCSILSFVQTCRRMIHSMLDPCKPMCRAWCGKPKLMFTDLLRHVDEDPKSNSKLQKLGD